MKKKKDKNNKSKIPTSKELKKAIDAEIIPSVDEKTEEDVVCLADGIEDINDKRLDAENNINLISDIIDKEHDVMVKNLTKEELIKQGKLPPERERTVENNPLPQLPQSPEQPQLPLPEQLKQPQHPHQPERHPVYDTLTALKKAEAEEAEEAEALAPNTERQVPKGLQDNQNDAVQKIWNKHSKRGDLAFDIVKTLLSETGLSVNSNDIVDYAFKVADQIQKQVDDAYNLEMLDHNING